MDEPQRDRAHRALKGHFERNTSPRSILSLIVALTGMVGCAASWAMLKLGETQMSIRYPVAVLVAYAAFLGMLRAWAEFERKRSNLTVENLKDTPEVPCANDSLKKWGSWLQFLDIPDFGDAEGCVVVCIAVVVLGVIISAVAAFISSAPALISDVFLDAVLMAALYKRLNRAARQHWLGTAIRRTWIAALFTAAALYCIGTVIELNQPGAKSIGDLWRMSHGNEPGQK